VRRRILHLVIVLALSVLLAFAVERFYFNRLALSAPASSDQASQPSVTLAAETLYQTSQGLL